MKPITPEDYLDLHAHSTASDGTDSPAEFVQHGANRGLRALALTDHDTMGGIPEFLSAAQKHGIVGIPGVEVSTEVDGRKLHILGLGIELDRAGPVEQFLKKSRDRRRSRNEELVQLLRDLGHGLELEEVEAEAGGVVVGRPHFARVLVKKGRVRTVQEAFDILLKDHGPAYVPKVKAAPEKVIASIRESGGLAIAAHPHTLAADGHRSLYRRLELLADWGLDGLEAWHPEVIPSLAEKLVRFAEQRDMVVSAGSDYHGRNKDRSPLGRWNRHHRIQARQVWALLQRLASRELLEID